jgi:hypothetical protein
VLEFGAIHSATGTLSVAVRALPGPILAEQRVVASARLRTSPCERYGTRIRLCATPIQLTTR